MGRNDAGGVTPHQALLAQLGQSVFRRQHSQFWCGSPSGHPPALVRPPWSRGEDVDAFSFDDIMSPAVEMTRPSQFDRLTSKTCHTD